VEGNATIYSAGAGEESHPTINSTKKGKRSVGSPLNLSKMKKKHIIRGKDE